MRLDGVRSTGIHLQSMNPTIPEATPPKDSTLTCAGYTEPTAQPGWEPSRPSRSWLLWVQTCFPFGYGRAGDELRTLTQYTNALILSYVPNSSFLIADGMTMTFLLPGTLGGSSEDILTTSLETAIARYIQEVIMQMKCIFFEKLNSHRALSIYTLLFNYLCIPCCRVFERESE